MAVDNKLLGTLVIDNIPPASKGAHQIKVWFQYSSHDEEILAVFTKSDGENIDRENWLAIPIQYPDQVDEIIVDAAEHQEEDRAAIKRSFETARDNSDELGFSCHQCDEEILHFVEGRTYNSQTGLWEVVKPQVGHSEL